ncbi:beta-hexosaminidase-like [Mercenaria mercenaria]|uniref:beta-hexosaminidase-like n=1 Tax=Mercenaria mercenaria TaxID=6596 RepID=UPI00234E59D2|nr:beta-hexosaminidase-like [Mercenaria mercenaria]
MPSTVHKYAACIVRKSSSSLFILCCILLISIGWTIVNLFKTRHESGAEQSVVDYIAVNLKVKIKAGDSMTTARSVQITLSNTGHKDILFGKWRIYFYSLTPSTTSKTAGFEVGWVNGGLYFLSPIKNEFQGISAGGSLDLIFREWKSSAKIDHFPNWFVASNTYGISSPRIIESTKDESLSFVSSFENSFQWKRHEFDTYNPYTPGERYEMNKAFQDATLKGEFNVIPTPFSVKIVPNKKIVFDDNWVVVEQASINKEHVPASRILAMKLGLTEVLQPATNRGYIMFESDKTFNKEQYEIKVEAKTTAIIITSSNGKGAFYGIQTLISMLDSSNIIPECIIKDHPRFPYRGLMIDVSRNFHNKETIKKLIDLMSLYKMNKLHMHLTDDEGWRIEIPSIPELTKYGSRRCNYFEKDKCLNPSLGSGPYSSGFYTVSDFREILRYAKERYVEVIPEIDVPGHALSAIKAMQYREQDLQRLKTAEKLPSYILSDDVSGISSVQGWMENSINPCLNATYRFIETILSDLQVIYQGIQKLDRIHFGGDEVPTGVWEKSKTCQSLFHGNSLDHSTIKKMFVFTVADIAHKHGLQISMWEDGVYKKTQGPYDVKEFKQEEVYVNAWSNMWEAQTGGRAIEFADSGYKVILSMATHLYFDHPYEPDPEERGLYWATRYIDTYKVFGFMPMNIYANAEFDSLGNKINLNDLCRGPCPNTKAPDNFVGMEACIWSETIRNETQLFEMTFPRLLAFAERVWHEAEWEKLKAPEEGDNTKRRDFKRFVDIIGKNELSRLEKAGVQYRIPPPGLTFTESNRVAKINNFYSGHKVMMSFGNDSKWRSVGKEIQIPEGVSDIHVYAVSPVLNRKSRIVSLDISNGADSMYTYFSCTCTFLILSLYVIVNS